jgi:transcriptional regulator with XRE-family HTH domain
VRAQRLMLGMSQTALADALGITFQQVQKYEKGANRISSSRLQGISQILGVPIPFFFEGAPRMPGQSGRRGPVPTPTYISEFLASSDGLALAKSFAQIGSTKLKRCVVRLVEKMGSNDEG